MFVAKKTLQKQLIAGAVSITALAIASFSYAQSVGGVIQGAQGQQSQQSQYASGSGNVQPVNQNAQIVLQLQALRAELASLRNQVEQQGYQLRQLQQSSGTGAINNSSGNGLGSISAPSSTVESPSSGSFQNGEILPNQPAYNSSSPSGVNQSQSNNTQSGDGSVQFPLLPQDQVDQSQVGSGSQQALPQLVPQDSSQVQQNRTGPIGQPSQSRPQSRQDRLLEEGDKLKGVQTNLGELELYNKGIDKLSSQDYKAAASIFSAQLQNFPRGEKAGDGYFWLGETFYIQDDLDSAAKSYQTLVDLFPNHIRTPRALLKLIGVHQERKDQVSAKIAMNALVAKYSGSAEADSARSQYSSLL